MSRPARMRLVLLAAVLLIAAGGLAFVFWPFGPDDEPLFPTVPTPKASCRARPGGRASPSGRWAPATAASTVRLGPEERGA